MESFEVNHQNGLPFAMGAEAIGRTPMPATGKVALPMNRVAVAPIFNLPYRRFVIGNASEDSCRWICQGVAERNSSKQQITNRRYGQAVPTAISD